LTVNINVGGFPQCKKCDAGVLLPVGSGGWKCSNPDCDFEL
jgi:hypothetical protein